MSENKNNRWKTFCNWARTFTCCKHKRTDIKNLRTSWRYYYWNWFKTFNFKYPKKSQHFDFAEHFMSGQYQECGKKWFRTYPRLKLEMHLEIRAMPWKKKGKVSKTSSTAFLKRNSRSLLFKGSSRTSWSRTVINQQQKKRSFKCNSVKLTVF